MKMNRQFHTTGTYDVDVDVLPLAPKTKDDDERRCEMSAFHVCDVSEGVSQSVSQSVLQ
jgi:hypothetical protein